MKKLKLSFFLVVLVAAIVFSCKKLTEETPAVSDLPKVQAFFTSTSIRDIKLVYGTLNTVEKAETWKIHFANIISSRIYNREQNLLIEELRDHVKPELFEIANPPQSPFIRNWLLKARKLFSIREVQYIVADLTFSFKDDKLKVGNQVADVEFGVPDCTCSSVSDFCGGAVYCSKCESCKTGPIGSGCGFLGNYTCNGKCISTTITPSPGCIN